MYTQYIKSNIFINMQIDVMFNAYLIITMYTTVYNIQMVHNVLCMYAFDEIPLHIKEHDILWVSLWADLTIILAINFQIS